MSSEHAHVGEINALLGRGTEFEGTLCFDGRVRIDGRFKGKIHSEGTLIVGDGAEIDAEVHVGRLIVRGGTLRGSVVATQVVELLAPSRVVAELKTPSFFLERGVHFDGRCTMGEGESATDVVPEPVHDEPDDGTEELPAVGVPVGDADDDGAADDESGGREASSRRRRKRRR